MPILPKFKSNFSTLCTSPFLTYYSHCCGKSVESHKQDKKDGYYIEGKYEHTGDYYCSRCMRDVTRTGGYKKTARNDDIDINGNWGYILKGGPD